MITKLVYAVGTEEFEQKEREEGKVGLAASIVESAISMGFRKKKRKKKS